MEDLNKIIQEQKIKITEYELAIYRGEYAIKYLMNNTTLSQEVLEKFSKEMDNCLTREEIYKVYLTTLNNK